MELRVLKYFQTVVATQNISRAAQQLHVSQPTISRQLKELESELGIILFKRGNRKIKLTPSGEYFANQVNQILSLTDKTLENIRTDTDITGSITIGSAESNEFAVISQIIKLVHNNYPKIKFHIESSNIDNIRLNLKAGIYDFGMILSPFTDDDLNFIPLPGKNEWGILAPINSPIASCNQITLNDLLNLNLIIPSRTGFHSTLDHWFGKSVELLNVVATYTLMYNATHLVNAGVGYVLGINGIINTLNTNLKFIPLQPQVTTTANLVWLRSQPLSSAAEKFLQTFQNH